MDYTNIPTCCLFYPAIGNCWPNGRKKPSKLIIKRISKSILLNLLPYTANPTPPAKQNSNYHCYPGKKGSLAFMVLANGVDEMIQGFAVAIKMGATKATDATGRHSPNRIRRICDNEINISLKLFHFSKGPLNSQ